MQCIFLAQGRCNIWTVMNFQPVLPSFVKVEFGFPGLCFPMNVNSPMPVLLCMYCSCFCSEWTTESIGLDVWCWWRNKSQRGRTCPVRSSRSSASSRAKQLPVLSSKLEWKWLTVKTSGVYITPAVLNKFLVSQFKRVFHHILYQSAEYS